MRMSRLTLAYLAISLIVLGLCWLYTADTALDPGNGDPYVYLHAAQTLREGQGLRNPAFDVAITQAITGEAGALMATWPPLYPVVLAALGGGLQAARMMNAVGLWLCLILGWCLLSRFEIAAPVRLGALIAFVIFMHDANRTFLSAASETLFIPLFWAWLIVGTRLTRARDVMLFSFLGAAMGLTRYIGIPLTLLGALWVLIRRGRNGIDEDVLLDVAGYVALPGLAFTWWLTRNWYTFGKLTGHSLAGDYTLSGALGQLIQVAGLWGQLVVMCGGVLWLLAWWWQRSRRSTWRSSSSAGRPP